MPLIVSRHLVSRYTYLYYLVPLYGTEGHLVSKILKFTSHLFDESLAQGRSFQFSGSAARVPSGMSAALFDAVYASAVLHHFGFAGTDILEVGGRVL